MKNIVKFISILILCFCLSGQAFAVEIPMGELSASEHYDDVVALEDEMLRILYHSSLSTRSSSTSQIAFDKAIKTYIIKPEDLVAELKAGTLFENYQSIGVPIWKIPVEITPDHWDYVSAAYDGTDFTSTSGDAENLEGEMHLFYPERTNDYLNQLDSEIKEVIVLTVANFGFDLITLVNEDNSLLFIPYSSFAFMPEKMSNGIVCTSDDVVTGLEELLSTETMAEDMGGGAGGEQEALELGTTAKLFFLLGATVLSGWFCAIQWKKLKKN